MNLPLKTWPALSLAVLVTVAALAVRLAQTASAEILNHTAPGLLAPRRLS